MSIRKRIGQILSIFVTAILISEVLGQEITFGAYNLQNYSLETGANGQKPKSTASKVALTSIIHALHPDILGVCEMASREALADLQVRLKSAGLDLPESEFVEGPDPDRHLALLSRFPIVLKSSDPHVTFELNGRAERVRRGFLDVTIQINNSYRLRLVGVHLKSKIAAPEGESLIRRMESHLLAQRISKILENEPETNLLVYGDFNDTKDQPILQSLIGQRGSQQMLRDLHAVDEHGECWTHYWKTADVYSRMDFLLASKGLLPEIFKKQARVTSAANWNEASDHRLISTSISATNH
jgi:endonuclease/exonuclease/phosphatase family metal-dependent hydrolase